MEDELELQVTEVIVDTARQLELYKAFISTILMMPEPVDFPTFSEWREQNKELIN